MLLRAMIPLACCLLGCLVLLPGRAAGSDERVYTEKTIYRTFGSFDEAQAWSIRGLAFDDWRKVVRKAGWKELHASATEAFYFALYRSGDHLIYCSNDRENAYRGGATSAHAVDDPLGYDVWEPPSKVSLLKYEVDYPTGGYSGQDVFLTWKIVDGFSGKIEVNARVKKDQGSPYEPALRVTVPWTTPVP